MIKSFISISNKLCRDSCMYQMVCKFCELCFANLSWFFFGGGGVNIDCKTFHIGCMFAYFSSSQIKCKFTLTNISTLNIYTVHMHLLKQIIKYIMNCGICAHDLRMFYRMMTFTFI